MQDSPKAQCWESVDPGVLWDRVWESIRNGVISSRSPAHTPTLATVSTEGLPLARTVVLRGPAGAGYTLTCHTHLGSGKVQELNAQPGCTWHFYLPDEKVQFRLEALATTHHQDEVAREAWGRTQLSSRRCYCTARLPGEVVAEPDAGLVDGLGGRQPTNEESEQYGWPNFVVIHTQVLRVELLYLRAAGHRRIRWDLEGGAPRCQWLIP